MYGEKENVKKILNGTYQPPEGISQSMRNLLGELKRPPQVHTSPIVSTELSTENTLADGKTLKKKLRREDKQISVNTKPWQAYKKPQILKQQCIIYHMLQDIVPQDISMAQMQCY